MLAQFLGPGGPLGRGEIVMQAVVRPHRHRARGVVIAAATAVAVAPVTPVVPWAHVLTAAERGVRLAAEGSLLNIPFNLFQDFVNVPYNEVQAANLLANSFFFTGSWFTPSATNIWGEDPGDPGHFMAVMDFMFPFAPEISGQYQPDFDEEALANGTAGLGQQTAMLAAAMLPVNPSCDSIQCWPMTPVNPITGLTGLDQVLRFGESLGGPNQLPLFSHWLQVPLQQLFEGYTFPEGPTSDPDNPTSAGIANPNEGIGPNGSVPDSYGFTGTRPLTDADGNIVYDEYGNQINLMPWAGLTFKFDPLNPFQQWFDSLLQPVNWSVNGDDPTVGFHLPTFTDIGQTMKAFTAGLVVDFNPFVAGSPFCAGLCTSPPLGLTTLDLVKAIQAMGEPNPQIQQWIDLTEQDAANAVGNANGSTDEQVMAGISALQTGVFTFDAQTQNDIIDLLAQINPYLPNLAVNSGLLTDPGLLGPWPVNPDTGYLMPPTWTPGVPLDEQMIGDYGGRDSSLLWEDLVNFFNPSAGMLTPDFDGLWSDFGSWFTF